jgi:hypothetical protein
VKYARAGHGSAASDALTRFDSEYAQPIKKAGDYILTLALALAAAFAMGVLFVRLWRTEEGPHTGPTAATLRDAALFLAGTLVGFLAVVLLRSLIAFVAGWRATETSRKT